MMELFLEGDTLFCCDGVETFAVAEIKPNLMGRQRIALEEALNEYRWEDNTAD